MQQQEINLNKTDLKELSRSAMRDLFVIAQKKVEIGGMGDFPYDVTQDAKEYFKSWYKELGMGFREHSFLILIPLLLIAYLDSIEIEILIIGFTMAWGAKLFFAVTRTRKVYIAEMLGDTRFLTEAQLEFYRKGLLVELYGFEDVKIKYLFTFVTFSVALGSLLIYIYTDLYREQLIALSAFSTIAFFATHLKDEIKYKETK